MSITPWWLAAALPVTPYRSSLPVCRGTRIIVGSAECGTFKGTEAPAQFGQGTGGSTGGGLLELN